MLLAEEFEGVPVAKAALSRLFPDSDIDRMVEEQPLLLVEDIELALSEIKRRVPHLTTSQCHVPNGRHHRRAGRAGKGFTWQVVPYLIRWRSSCC